MQPTRPTCIPGVILDLDGTLADTLDDITGSVSEVFVANGLPAVDRDLVRPAVGDGAAELLRRLSGRDDEADIHDLLARFRSHYAEHSLDSTELYPGWPEVLDELTRRGAPLAVLSNKPDGATQQICRELLARWPGVHVRGQRDGIPLKPDPTVALELCGLMQRSPGEVLFVGDSRVDVETALRGGMAPVGVTWGFRDADELRTAGAWHIIEAPGELLQLVGAAS